MARPLVVRVGDLLRDPGSRRDVDRSVELEPLATSSASTIPGLPVLLDATVTSMPGGLEVVGEVTFDWYGDCRRCLEDVTGRQVVDFREVAQRDPVDDDVLPVDDDLLDLEPLVRELVLGSMPLAPLCAEDCAGPDPDRFPTSTEAEEEAHAATEAEPDPRWAALSDLDFGSAPDVERTND